MFLIILSVDNLLLVMCKPVVGFFCFYLCVNKCVGEGISFCGYKQGYTDFIHQKVDR